MKSTYFAVVLTLSLLFSCDLSAEARPASSHSGTSSGFKGGFSSQKGNYARSAPAPSLPPAQRSGPGSFGKAGGADAPPPQPSRSSSALARDMEQNAAQANALKTLDARRAAANPPNVPLPPLRDPVMRPQQPGQPPVYNQPGYAQQNLPPQQPIIVQQPSNGFMHGVIGFMLGRAMSQPQPAYYPPNNNGGHGNSSSNGGDWDSNATLAGSTGTTSSAAMAPVAAPAPSFGATVLRLFVWLALVSALVWLGIYTVRKLRRLRAANTAHYSFERN